MGSAGLKVAVTSIAAKSKRKAWGKAKELRSKVVALQL
jgi:hypothetical protein